MKVRNVKRMSPDEFNKWWLGEMIDEHRWQKGDQVEVRGKMYRLDRVKKNNWHGWDESTGNYTEIPSWSEARYTGYSEEYTG